MPEVLRNPSVVRECTGFAIGGVAPVGHATRVASYVEKSRAVEVAA